MMTTPGRCANTGQAFSHGSKEGFAMAAKTTSTTRGNLIPAAGAIVALGAAVAGCQADSAALMYAQEAHAQQVATWCYAYSGVTTASPLGQECVRRAWVGVPPGECNFFHSCVEQFNAFYQTGRYRAPHHARRELIAK